VLGPEITDVLRAKPYLVAVIAAIVAQTVKVVAFIILEKRVNYRRFVETDGAPNMHSAALAALSLYVGFIDGIDSVLFSVSASMTALMSVDLWNVKRAASRHAEIIDLIFERIGESRGDLVKSRKVLSYTPVDVLSGVVLGMVTAMLML